MKKSTPHDDGIMQLSFQSDPTKTVGNTFNKNVNTFSHTPTHNPVLKHKAMAIANVT